MRAAAPLLRLLPVAVFLSACAPLSTPRVGAEAEPLVGDQIVLTRGLEVMPGTIVGWFEPRFYQTSVPSLQSVLFSDPLSNALRCGLRLRQPVPRGEPAAVLGPATLTVKKVVLASDPAGVDPSAVSMQGGPSTDVVLKYRIDVGSADQPRIAAFFCQQRYPMLNRGTAFPTAIELRQQAGAALQWSSDGAGDE